MSLSNLNLDRLKLDWSVPRWPCASDRHDRCSKQGKAEPTPYPSNRRTVGHISLLSQPTRTLGTHAQRGLQYLPVCLSLCLSVYDYSRTTGYEAADERYQQLQCYKGKKYNVAILLKRLRSRDIEAKKPIA